MSNSAAGVVRPTYRILIVEDDVERWSEQMVEHIAARRADLDVTCTQAADADQAERQLLCRHFHLVSLDMLIPGKTGEIRAVDGIDLARLAYKSGALVSKLLVYSGLLGLQGNNPRDSASVHAGLPKLDRYAKSGSTDSDITHSIEGLTQGQWAERVLQYLRTDAINLPSTGGGEPHKTVIGTWLDAAPKHLPVLLARHAQTLANTWADPSAVTARFDAALRFIETATRMALLQTQVLLAHNAGSRAGLHPPRDARPVSCIELLCDLVNRNSSVLSHWSWLNYLQPALHGMNEARLLRNADRHSLNPGVGQAAWVKIRPLLQAAMDLSAYWALHPIWTELRFTHDGWSGERLAGNFWPRQRRKVDLDVAFHGEEVHGGAWQTAVRIDGPEPKIERVDWRDWLDADTDGRAWWFLAHTEQRGSRLHHQYLDLDSGNYRGQFVGR